MTSTQSFLERTVNLGSSSCLTGHKGHHVPTRLAPLIFLWFLWLLYCLIIKNVLSFQKELSNTLMVKLMSITTFWWEKYSFYLTGLIKYYLHNVLVSGFYINQKCLSNVSLHQILFSHSPLCCKWLRVSNILGFYWTKSPLDFCRKMPVSSAAVMWSDNTSLCWVVKRFVLCSVATFRFCQVWSCSIPRWLLLVCTIVNWESEIPSTLLFICFYLLSHTNTVTTH